MTENTIATFIQHALPTILTAYFGYLNTKNQRIGEETVKALKAEISELRGLFDSLNARVQTLTDTTNRIEKTALENRDANKYITRYRLQHDIRLAIYRGYTTLEDRQEFSKLYSSYVSLGGNGEIKDLWKIYTKLEIREEE